MLKLFQNYFISHVTTALDTSPYDVDLPSPPLDNIRVKVIVWRSNGNIRDFDSLIACVK